MKFSKRNLFRIVWLGAVVIFFLWNGLSYQARNLPPGTLQSGDVTVSETEDMISFTPPVKSKTVFLFFPGALVEPAAYAPMAKRMAAGGYESHIIKMPWRMASNGYQRLKNLFELSDTSKNYVLSGHSQGGKMAAQFVYENKDVIAGLVLMGTSHPRDIDLSSIEIPVLKLYASHDGLASVEEVNENKSKLPAHTRYVEIKGGNHAHFGYYGSQLGDGSATINRKAQLDVIVQTMLGFLGEFK